MLFPLGLESPSPLPEIVGDDSPTSRRCPGATDIGLSHPDPLWPSLMYSFLEAMLHQDLGFKREPALGSTHQGLNIQSLNSDVSDVPTGSEGGRRQ